MKRGSIISLTIVAYIVAMIAMFFGVQEYIKNKDNRLRNEIHDKIAEIFANQDQFVDIAYSGYKVGSENVSIPPKPVDLGGRTWMNGNKTMVIYINYIVYFIRVQTGQVHTIMKMDGIL